MLETSVQVYTAICGCSPLLLTSFFQQNSQTLPFWGTDSRTPYRSALVRETDLEKGQTRHNYKDTEIEPL